MSSLSERSRCLLLFTGLVFSIFWMGRSATLALGIASTGPLGFALGKARPTLGFTSAEVRPEKSLRSSYASDQAAPGAQMKSLRLCAKSYDSNLVVLKTSASSPAAAQISS